MSKKVHSSDWRNVDDAISVAELFAGVGGFRLGLDGYQSEEHPEFDMPSAGGFATVWANQWEPPGTNAKQFAWRCYEERFGAGTCVNEDIHKVLDGYEAGTIDIPDVDMVVGGFPCQDYSVAKPLAMAGGIEGKKGVLWWDIHRFLRLKPSVRYCLFENVDRLLKSPAAQRGRDFAIILSCLMSLGFSVEWRVVNSAEYGFPQRRKRLFIYAERNATWDLRSRMADDGVIADALPCKIKGDIAEFRISDDPYDITKSWSNQKVSPFFEAGAASGFNVVTCHVEESYAGPRRVLGDVVLPSGDVPAEFWVPDDQLPKWQYLKGAKREERTTKDGFTYWYSEGSMTYPDLLMNPSRTILTGEGGRGASRFKHIIGQDGRMRRLVPDELDMLQTFPRGWTDTGMTDGQRAFCMGNALVVGVVHRIGESIADRIGD